MSGRLQQMVTLRRPVHTPKTGADGQLEHGFRDEFTVMAWVKQLAAEKSLAVTGLVGTKTFSVRFRAPDDLAHEPDAGWQLRDRDGKLYQVVSAPVTGRIYSMLVERT